VEGGREDRAGDGPGGSIDIDFRRSAKEDRRSLIISLTIDMEDLRSFLTSFDVRLSRIVSLRGDGGATIAF
jgi:hypothetical protein